MEQQKVVVFLRERKQGAGHAQLSTPSGVAFDHSGNMFIADFSNNVVRRVDAFSASTGSSGIPAISPCALPFRQVP